MKLMAEVWFAIAKEIYHHNPVGPFLCNIAGQMYRSRGPARYRISYEQWLAVIDAVDEERVKQYGVAGDQVLWGTVCNDQLERVLRIRFCAEQIRRAK